MLRPRLAQFFYLSIWLILITIYNGQILGINANYLNTTLPNSGGDYGFWKYDKSGLPCFVYTLDELTSPIASWPNSEQILGVNRTDHFQMIGNQRCNCKIVDDGYVEFLWNDRGPTWANGFDLDSLQLGGGFSYIAFNSANDSLPNIIYSSAYKFGPHGQGFQYERIFGMGYYENKFSFPLDGGIIQIDRKITVPYGDHPLLVDEVEIKNIGKQFTPPFQHFEYFDVNRWFLNIEWARTGVFAPPQNLRRMELNKKFNQSVTFDSSTNTLLSSMQPTELPPVSFDDISRVDYFPPVQFLTVIKGPAPNKYFGDQNYFFGGGNASLPNAVAFNFSSMLLSSYPAETQAAMFSFMHEIKSLAPGESINLTFAYGYIPFNNSLEGVLNPLRNISGSIWMNSTQSWSKVMPRVKLEFKNPINISDAWAEVLEREFSWRGMQLQANSLYHSYYDRFLVPQGSEYLYLSGADGAPRDTCYFVLALTYLSPFLARQSLEMLMMLQGSGSDQYAAGSFPYAWGGYGARSPALGLHIIPSDLDIYFSWAMTEYLTATGDLSFLNHSLPFHPKNSTVLPPGANGNSVLDHIQVSFTHLRDRIGKGPHGLIKIRQGDWDDGVVYTDPEPRAILNTVEFGESIPNSQIALKVFPLLAEIISPFNDTLSQEMQNFAKSLEIPVKHSFGTKWFARAWMRTNKNESYLRGNDAGIDGSQSYIDLQSQPWGLLNFVLNETQISTLLYQVDVQLQEPSPIGPLQSPSNYEVWSAISQLMTWAYAVVGAIESAWENLIKQTYTMHATVFPTVWLAIWSGPDGWVSQLPPNATGQSGGTWSSFVTPMTDFPVSNMNGDAQAVTSMLRLLGVEPTSSGLLINSSRSGIDFDVDLPLLRISHSSYPGNVAVIYRPANNGLLKLQFWIPPTQDKVSCVVDSAPFSCSVSSASLIPINISITKSQNVNVTISW